MRTKERMLFEKSSSHAFRTVSRDRNVCGGVNNIHCIFCGCCWISWFRWRFCFLLLLSFLRFIFSFAKHTRRTNKHVMATFTILYAVAKIDIYVYCRLWDYCSACYDARQPNSCKRNEHFQRKVDVMMVNRELDMGRIWVYIRARCECTKHRRNAFVEAPGPHTWICRSVKSRIYSVKSECRWSHIHIYLFLLHIP